MCEVGAEVERVGYKEVEKRTGTKKRPMALKSGEKDSGSNGDDEPKQKEDRRYG